MKESEKRLAIWIYNKILWMLAGCILLLGVWIFTCYNLFILDQSTKLTTFLFVMAFISLACYVWEKRETYSRELEYG